LFEDLISPPYNYSDTRETKDTYYDTRETRKTRFDALHFESSVRDLLDKWEKNTNIDTDMLYVELIPTTLPEVTTISIIIIIMIIYYFRYYYHHSLLVLLNPFGLFCLAS
jgi:hypothetical protein